jgi:catechol 2,3-dioxygenase-like lactoylglutathione lyase family enzyme
MKLNHLNLTVTDVRETRQFLEKYFGLESMDKGENNQIAQLRDDDGLGLTLIKVGEALEVHYPASFHIGFIQESEAQVDEINQRLKADGYDVPPPRRFHGSWTFYFRAPGGFTIEVLTEARQSRSSYSESAVRYPTIAEQFKAEGA